MCDCDIGESPEFYSSEWRHGTREHRCCECRRVIPAGELHRYIVGKWEGDVSWFRMCARCDALHRAHSSAEAVLGEPGCRAPLGTLFSQIRECVLGDGRYARSLQAALRKLRAPGALEATANA
jgi:hypothetical protein